MMNPSKPRPLQRQDFSAHGVTGSMSLAEISETLAASRRSTGDRPAERALSKSFDARQRQSLTHASGALAVFYLLLAPLHFSLVEPAYSGVMASVAVASALVLGALRYLLQSRFFIPGTSNLFGMAVVLISGANSGVHIHLTQDLVQTTNFIVLVVGIGAVFFDRHWLLAAEATVLIWWSVGIMGAEDRGLLPHYSIALFIALFLSFLIHHIRRSDVVQLEIANRELSRRAHHDPLTGLANRSTLRDGLSLLCRSSARQGASVAVLLCDADSFKSFNDRQGHLAGDKAIRELARAVRGMARRPHDLAVRFGGDEFVLVLPGVTLETAYDLAERLRQQVFDLGLIWGDEPNERITLSVGVASGIPDPADIGFPIALLKAADEACYRAKEQGGDQVDWSYFFAEPTGIGEDALAANDL
ncbi:MAG: GGDEF domain-containing protein [Acidobacteriota bacterium]